MEELTWAQLEFAYDPAFEVNKLPEEQKKKFMQHRFSTEFPTFLVILLHFLTFGIFTIIYFGFKHSQLPKVKQNDFGAGKAIGFSFIPFFNLYWMFRFWLRLVDAVNFQYKLRGKEAPVSRGTAMAAIILLVLSVIPYLGFFPWFVGFAILLPIVLAQIQIASNKLANESKISIGQPVQPVKPDAVTPQSN